MPPLPHPRPNVRLGTKVCHPHPTRTPANPVYILQTVPDSTVWRMVPQKRRCVCVLASTDAAPRHTRRGGHHFLHLRIGCKMEPGVQARLWESFGSIIPDTLVPQLPSDKPARQ